MPIRDDDSDNISSRSSHHHASVTDKEFGCDDNNGKSAMTWKNREKDWYNAERRFIFAA